MYMPSNAMMPTFSASSLSIWARRLSICLVCATTASTRSYTCVCACMHMRAQHARTRPRTSSVHVDKWHVPQECCDARKAHVVELLAELPLASVCALLATSPEELVAGLAACDVKCDAAKKKQSISFGAGGIESPHKCAPEMKQDRVGLPSHAVNRFRCVAPDLCFDKSEADCVRVTAVLLVLFE